MAASTFSDLLPTSMLNTMALPVDAPPIQGGGSHGMSRYMLGTAIVLVVVGIAAISMAIHDARELKQSGFEAYYGIVLGALCLAALVLGADAISRAVYGKNISQDVHAAMKRTD